jgi:nucleotide-binding universal stress UspA family protein
MNPIIVATDLSERADMAVRRAFLIAGETGADVIVLHVVDSALPQRMGRLMAAEARDRIAAQVASMPSARGIVRTLQVETGQPHRTILRCAAERDAGLIVFGMHRETGLADFFRGTTVARVAVGGVWPVLVVRDPPERPYSSALLAVDFSESCRRALRCLRAMAPNAKRQILHAYAVPLKGYLGAIRAAVTGPSMSDVRMQDQEARRLVADFQHETQEEALPAIVEEGPFEDVLADVMERIRPELVAIGAHSRVGLSRLLLGGTAERLMRDPPADLLVA